MSRELRNFFVELSTNPLLVETFEADPVTALEATNLSEEDKRLVMSRDLAEISNRLLLQGPPATETAAPPRKKPGGKKKKAGMARKKSTPKPKK